jgi:hypothetical protein
MDQISELKRSERRQKEALMSTLLLIEEIIAELKSDPAKAIYLKDKVRGIQLLMR